MEIITNAWETSAMLSWYEADKHLLVHATKHISGWKRDSLPYSALRGDGSYTLN